MTINNRVNELREESKRIRKQCEDYEEYAEDFGGFVTGCDVTNMSFEYEKIIKELQTKLAKGGRR